MKKKKIKKEFKSRFDPNGAYTGNPINGVRPIQDADDL